MGFQSTLSMRRATDTGNGTGWTPVFQSTLSMRRATVASGVNVLPSTFQSTLSMRRATVASFDLAAAKEISIHALHEESDMTSCA